MIERGVLAEGQDGVFELHTYNVDGLKGQFPSCGRGDYRRCQHEPLQRPQSHPLQKPRKVEVAKDVSFAFINPVPEAVC